MPADTIRDVTEAMRAAPDTAARLGEPLRLGSALAETSERLGLTNADVEVLEQGRRSRIAEPLLFV